MFNLSCHLYLTYVLLCREMLNLFIGLAKCMGLELTSYCWMCLMLLDEFVMVFVVPWISLLNCCCLLTGPACVEANANFNLLI